MYLGITFDNAMDKSERKTSPRSLQALDGKADSPKEGLRFEPPVNGKQTLVQGLYNKLNILFKTNMFILLL